MIQFPGEPLRMARMLAGLSAACMTVGQTIDLWDLLDIFRGGGNLTYSPWPKLSNIAL